MSLLRKGLPAALLASLVLSGCPGPDASLEIVSPSDGAMLSLATDTNPGLPGVQTQVVVHADGIAVGDPIDLVIDNVIVTSLPTPDDGVIVFDDVTLSPGMRTLRASRAGSLESPIVTVEVASDDCFPISFVTPMPSGTRVTLGPADDTDGEACGATFETTVVVAAAGAAEGSNARLFVNGMPLRTSTVSGGVARFEGVALDRREPQDNSLRVEITGASGVVCSESFPVPIVVDCEGVSCTITSPDPSSGFLNQSHDVSDEPGFQGTFEVTTDLEGLGQPVRLIIDGNETDALTATPSGTVATFGNVSLSEGDHWVQAECRDAVGNITRSARHEWTVDTIPCAITIESPENGTRFIDADDLDPSTSNIDIDVEGTAGVDCEELRVGLCSAIGGQAFGAASTSYSERVELGTAALQEVCVEARDRAGNLSRASVDVRVVTEAPQLEIASPAAGTGFNIAGNEGRTADLLPETEACDARFEVYCTAIGEDVEILREGSSTVLARATCAAAVTVPPPYTGMAVFDAVPLPSVETGAAYNVFARQTDGLTGTSASISIFADCAPPRLTVTRPRCGSTLTMSLDENPSTEELEYRTNVLFSNGRSGDEVNLIIRAAGGGAVTYEESRPFESSPVNFPNANYGAGGVLEITATATDSAGNVGQSSACSVTVEDLPSVTITSPGMGAVLGAADDCDPATPGMQVRVRGTTDAAPGSAVNVEVGSETTAGFVGAGGMIDICASASDGRNVPIRTSVTDTRGTGTASLTVVIDTQPPTTPIDDLSVTIEDRRGGKVRFSWTAVADEGGFTLTRYEGRCADAPITTEAEWNAAVGSTLLTVPGAAGTTQSETLGGLRTGETRYCALRAADPTGALTPLGSSVEVFLPFLEQEVAMEGTTALGTTIVPVGDVNGDNIDDVLVAGTEAVYLYFGSSSGTLDSTPSVTITGGSGWGLAGLYGLAGIGDFNGDGLADFAIGAYMFGGLKGAVFVFYGRPVVSPWPAELEIAAGPTSCTGADVCFLGDDGDDEGGPDEDAGFGSSVGAAGDFDGDGIMDLAVGAPGALDLQGRVYILLGRTTAYPSGTVQAVPGAGAGPDGFVLDANPERMQVGNIVTSLGGDLDGDGLHDLLIHSAGRPIPPEMDARVDFLAGRAFTGSGLVTIPTSALEPIGSGAARFYGLPVTAAGDVNGDGVLDVALCTRSSSGVGEVTYLLGAAGGFVGASAFTVTNDASNSAGDEFGYSVGAGRHPWLGLIGDIDGDHIADGLFGSKQLGAETAGYAHLLYFTSPASDRARSSGVSLGPFTAGTTLFAAFVGDINGDGYSDIALGDSAGDGRIIILY